MKKSNSLKITFIPTEFKGYFWDCDFFSLDLQKHRNFVLGRLLQYGGFQAMKWIRNHYNIQEVNQYLKMRGNKELDKRSYTFWKKCLKIEEIWRSN
ncbi:hypothetical protein JW935_23485 [candidate division KSB1 bacterium]|nr:hypothetical protein [candidate division KSB1 bacterium]